MNYFECELYEQTGIEPEDIPGCARFARRIPGAETACLIRSTASQAKRFTKSLLDRCMPALSSPGTFDFNATARRFFILKSSSVTSIEASKSFCRAKSYRSSSYSLSQLPVTPLLLIRWPFVRPSKRWQAFLLRCGIKPCAA